MRTTRAKPSSATDSTVPTASTCPCTIWPPSGSPSRSGNSRFTRSPPRSWPNAVRRSVSAITSASRPAAPSPVAVRHTPFTATEPPLEISSRGCTSTTSRPSASDETRPVRCTSPVNIRSPLSQPRADQHVVVDPLDLGVQRAQGVRDALHALALHGGLGLAAAGQDRGDEYPRLVDLAELEEAAGQVGPALQQQRLDVARAELVECVGP